MQKMLVCDFDNTVKVSSKYITHLNFDAIKRFRNNGNKLVFASGRYFNSLKRQLNYYACEYDALICNNGGIAFDNNDNRIFNDNISEEKILQLIYYFYGQNPSLFYDIRKYNYKGYTHSCNNILKMVVFLRPFRNHSKIIKELNNHFQDYLSNNHIHIRNKGSKSDGIKKLNEIYKIPEENIYTVGNGKRDYEMIRDYNGYNTIISHPSLYLVSNGTVSNVAKLVKKIENK